MIAGVSRLVATCAIFACVTVVLGGCAQRGAALTVAPAQPVAPDTPVQVCYTLPGGTQAAFLTPALNGAPGFHDVTDTPSACATVRARRTTRYTLGIVGERDSRTTLTAVLAVSTPTPAPVAVVTPKPRPKPTPRPTAKPTAKPAVTAIVTAVEAVPNGGLCPSSIDVHGGIALPNGGPISYRILIDGHQSGATHVVRIPVRGNISVTQTLPFPAQKSAGAAIAVITPGAFVSRTLAFRVNCSVAPPAQIAIWKRASDVRCQPGSGFLGSGCARTVNAIIAKALGHSIPPGAPPFYCGGMRAPGQPWDPQATHVCSPTWVPDVVQMIEEHAQFGRALNRNETVPGDIAVQDGTNAQRGMNHIGFCEDVGCHFVLSNRSSTGELCGHTNATMSDNGYPYNPNYTPTFYRVYGVAEAGK